MKHFGRRIEQCLEWSETKNKSAGGWDRGEFSPRVCPLKMVGFNPATLSDG